MEGRPGSIVVIGLLLGLAALIVVIVLAFVLFEPEGAPCAGGNLAANPRVDGQYLPRMETFETVEEAEAFICHDVPELHAEGWTLKYVSAERTLPIEFIVEGSGFASVTLTYVADGSSIILESAPFALDVPQFTSPAESVQVQGREGHILDLPPTTVWWSTESLNHLVIASGLEREELLALLETLR